ncbi:MAG: AAC(3) family N-acetyltransferase [Rhodospirillaceae bacterium]|nr:AAC(3) family N-acetyltransferase [Rhodospirillaceae bacterium]|tara:strand:- start:34 stop:810 length:777 start_codon:yes stop_codon:yes gene_type:complete
MELATKTKIVDDLMSAGIKKGDTLLAHTSLSKLGFVPGAAQTVIASLLEVVGPGGTLMMPTYSGELSDPAEWRHPPIPESWVQPIIDETPPYDPRLTPTRRMGVVAELFRHYPGVIRSPHPQSSFAAIGPNAEGLVSQHPLNYRFGPESPLGKLKDVGGKILLLGAPLNTCSFLYLTQLYMENNVEIIRKSPIRKDGKSVWVEYKDVVYSNKWFEEAINYLLKIKVAERTKIGSADSYILPARETIDAVLIWRRQTGV